MSENRTAFTQSLIIIIMKPCIMLMLQFNKMMYIYIPDLICFNFCCFHAMAMSKSNSSCPIKQRNAHMNLPPFLTRQSDDRFTLLRVAASLAFQLFSLSLTHGHKNMLLGTQIRFASKCLLSVPRAHQLNDLLTMIK
jgi:hypothetical protein